MPTPVSTSVSAEKLAVPEPLKFAPVPGNVAFAQPLPSMPLFEHGQGVPLPSPLHTAGYCAAAVLEKQARTRMAETTTRRNEVLIMAGGLAGIGGGALSCGPRRRGLE